MDRRVLSALSLLAAALVIGPPGCAGDAVLVDVQLSGLTDDVRVLTITPTIGGREVLPQTLSSHLDSFVVKLPTGTTGSLALSILAETGAGCEASRGTGQITILALERASMRIEMHPASAPGCGVVIEIPSSHGGLISVRSDVPGIDCGERCSATFPLGTTVTLSWKGLFPTTFPDCVPATNLTDCVILIKSAGVRLAVPPIHFPLVYSDMEAPLFGCTVPSRVCHGTDKPNAATRYKSGAAADMAALMDTYQEVRKSVDLEQPAESRFLTTVLATRADVRHEGGKYLAGETDPFYQRWLTWIRAGAPF